MINPRMDMGAQVVARKSPLLGTLLFIGHVDDQGERGIFIRYCGETKKNIIFPFPNGEWAQIISFVDVIQVSHYFVARLGIAAETCTPEIRESIYALIASEPRLFVMTLEPSGGGWDRLFFDLLLTIPIESPINEIHREIAKTIHDFFAVSSVDFFSGGRQKVATFKWAEGEKNTQNSIPEQNDLTDIIEPFEIHKWDSDRAAEFMDLIITGKIKSSARDSAIFLANIKDFVSTQDRLKYLDLAWTMIVNQYNQIGIQGFMFLSDAFVSILNIFGRDEQNYDVFYRYTAQLWKLEKEIEDQNHHDCILRILCLVSLRLSSPDRRKIVKKINKRLKDVTLNDKVRETFGSTVGFHRSIRY